MIKKLFTTFLKFSALALLIVTTSCMEKSQRSQEKTEISNEGESIKEMKKEIISYYQPSCQNCGAAASLDQRNEFVGTVRFEMACLIQGSRTVLWATLEDLKKSFDNPQEQRGPLYDKFIKVLNAENVQELDGMTFRPEGKRNALLFIKHLYDDHEEVYYNNYLAGYLLEYNEKDIEFLPQRRDFNQYIHTNKIMPDNYWLPASYQSFPIKLKELFNEFRKDVWPGSKGQRIYKLEKYIALDWLEKNKRFADDELYKQVEALKKTKKKPL